jgi:hypothetical protein
MKLSHRLGLVAATAVVLVGGGAGAAGAASSSGGHLNARFIAIGDAEAPTPVSDAPECEQVALTELPEGITLPDGVDVASGVAEVFEGEVLEGEIIEMGAVTSSGSVSVDADGNVTTSGDVPQEILDAIEAGTFGTEMAPAEGVIDAASGLVVVGETTEVPVEGAGSFTVDAAEAAADGLVVSCMVVAAQATETVPG